jgi:hypothetical protein
MMSMNVNSRSPHVHAWAGIVAQSSVEVSSSVHVLDGDFELAVHEIADPVLELGGVQGGQSHGFGGDADRTPA